MTRPRRASSRLGDWRARTTGNACGASGRRLRRPTVRCARGGAAQAASSIVLPEPGPATGAQRGRGCLLDGVGHRRAGDRSTTQNRGCLLDDVGHRCARHRPPAPAAAAPGPCEALSARRHTIAQVSEPTPCARAYAAAANAMIAPSVQPLCVSHLWVRFEAGGNASGSDEKRHTVALHEDQDGAAQISTAMTFESRELPLLAMCCTARRYSGDGRNIAAPRTNDHFWLVVARCDHAAMRPGSRPRR